MKIVKKNVYYCEFCKKKGLSAPSITKHEKRCTGNPNRECGICEVLIGASPNIGELVAEFKKRFELSVNNELVNFDVEHHSHIVKWIGEPVTIEEVKKSVDGCPNCTLAIIRQTGLNAHYFKKDFGEFDYKGEFNTAMKEVSAAKNERYKYDGY